MLGPATRIENVLEGLLVETGSRQRFEPHDAPEPSLEGRVDLRELLTYTVDPDTAKDFDDALSFRGGPEGIRAWVHIADVSYFVGAGTPLDHGAMERAFSTYVPGTVAPMLPHDLADDLCSLRPNEDRLCVTVELPPERRAALLPLGHPVGRAAHLRPGRAPRRAAGRPRVPRAERPLATEWRAARFARGALQVQTPEEAFRFDGDGGVADAWLEAEAHAHVLVEELMIRANEVVGELLSSRRREALYRVHERPGPAGRRAPAGEAHRPRRPDAAGAEEARAAGGSGTRRGDLRARGRVRRPVGPRPLRLSSLVLRALKRARYDPRNLGHSGLASTAYCHFTSPIRRYPDLVVHRALLRELGQGDDPLPEDLHALAEHTSEREREAAKVEYLADEICLAWLLERRLYEEGWDAKWEGEIVGLIGSGLFVRFGEVFEGFIPARRLHGEFFELNPLGTALRGRSTGPRLPARRRDRRPGRVDRAQRGQDRAGARAVERRADPRRNGPGQMSRRSCAQRVSSCRDESCSLRRTLETCASTVFTDRWSRAAISL